MRRRITVILAIAALGLAVPAAGLAEQSMTIGTGTRSCVLGPGADCRGVVHRWTVEHHGNLRNARFAKADLRGVDFRGADLRNADFRGAKLRFADLRGANLKGARFSAPPTGRAHARQGSYYTYCVAATGDSGTDLVGANLQAASLQGANFSLANMQGANLEGANLLGADFTQTNLASANLRVANLKSAVMGAACLTYADLTGANLALSFLDETDFLSANLTAANLRSASVYLTTDFTNAVFADTICPDGTVSSTGCAV